MEDWVSCDACGEVVKNPWRGGEVNCPNCGRLLVLINPVRPRRVWMNGMLKYGVGIALVCGAAVFGLPWLFSLLVDDRPGRQLIEVQPSPIASGIVEWEPSSTIPNTCGVRMPIRRTIDVNWISHPTRSRGWQLSMKRVATFR